MCQKQTKLGLHSIRKMIKKKVDNEFNSNVSAYARSIEDHGSAINLLMSGGTIVPGRVLRDLGITKHSVRIDTYYKD